MSKPTLPKDPNELFSAAEQKKLNEDLMRIALLRRKAEIESAGIQMH